MSRRAAPHETLGSWQQMGHGLQRAGRRCQLTGSRGDSLVHTPVLGTHRTQRSGTSRSGASAKSGSLGGNLACLGCLTSGPVSRVSVDVKRLALGGDSMAVWSGPRAGVPEMWVPDLALLASCVTSGMSFSSQSLRFLLCNPGM